MCWDFRSSVAFPFLSWGRAGLGHEHRWPKAAWLSLWEHSLSPALHVAGVLKQAFHKNHTVKPMKTAWHIKISSDAFLQYRSFNLWMVTSEPTLFPYYQKPWFSSPHSLLANYYKIQTRNFLVCHTQSRKLPLIWGEGADTAAVWRGSSLKSKWALSHALWLHSWPMIPGFIGKFPVSLSQKECCTFWLSLTTEDPLFIPYYSHWC